MIKITKATNNQAGITLLSLIITIIILLILATVAMSTFKGDGIIKNSQKAVDMAKVESMREEIKMAIINEIVKNDREITIEQIIEQLEKQGIIKAGDCNIETGQVKTQPDGYVYEIKEKANGDWEVTYIGNGELTLPELLIALSPNTTGITNSVTITMTAKAESGISSYTLPKGTEQNVASGTKEITTTYTATENGTYTFTVTNGNGKTESKSITIDNILEGVIVISASPTTPTKEKVTVTVTWPSEASSAIKEMQVGEGNWQVCTGEESSVEVMVNCTVKARVRNSVEEIKTATCEITNIDKTNPTVTAKEEAVTITEGDSHSLGEYFTITANGTYGIASTVYTDTSNGNAVVSNTNTLAVGTHTIKCTVTKETGASANASMTIVVESALTILSSTTKFTDTLGNSYTVPGGFGVRTDLATTVDKGIVIEDSDGNQFVWVPVGTITKSDGSTVTIELGRYTFDTSNGTPALQQSASNYAATVTIESEYTELATFRESNFKSDTSGLNATAYKLKEWIDTTKANGGYYIARYEASFGSGDTISSVSSGTAAVTNQKPQFKQSKSAGLNDVDGVTSTPGMLWNYIRQGDASKACRNMYEGNEYNGKDYVDCDLVNSYAWDTAIVFIEKCSDNSNYANANRGSNTELYNTGTDTGKTTDMVCNIYDMAGNLEEWTTETCSGSYLARRVPLYL